MVVRRVAIPRILPPISPASETAGVYTTGTNCWNQTFKRPHPSETVVFQVVLYQSFVPSFCILFSLCCFLLYPSGVLPPFGTLHESGHSLPVLLLQSQVQILLCYGGVSSSQYVTSMMGLLRFGMQSGAVEQLSRITKVVGRSGIIHGRELNSVPSDYDAPLLPASPPRTVTWCSVTLCVAGLAQSVQ